MIHRKKFRTFLVVMGAIVLALFSIDRHRPFSP
jgi:hypothetical protein